MLSVMGPPELPNASVSSNEAESKDGANGPYTGKAVVPENEIELASIEQGVDVSQ
jgi:hypothetical protein